MTLPEYLPKIKLLAHRKYKQLLKDYGPAPKRDRIGDLEKEVKALREEIKALKANVAKASVALKSVAANLVTE